MAPCRMAPCRMAPCGAGGRLGLSYSQALRPAAALTILLALTLSPGTALAEGGAYQPSVGGSAEFYGAHLADETGRERYGLGFGVAAFFEFSPVRGLGLQLGGTGMWLSKDASQEATYYAGMATGFRLHPWEWLGIRSALRRSGQDLWLDLHYAYGSSGGVRRSGFDTGIGYAFPVGRGDGGQLEGWRLGPFFRYQLGEASAGQNPSILTFGLSVGLPGWRKHREEAPDTRDHSDRGDPDFDYVPSSEDACPKEPGAPSTDKSRHGCPGALLIREGEIEVFKRLPFAPGTAVLLPEGKVLVARVADALLASPFIDLVLVECRSGVRGTDMSLINLREEAIVRELRLHGVSNDKLVTDPVTYRERIEARTTTGNEGAEYFVLPFLLK